MKIDMHIHTNYSDGMYSPLQIIDMCKEKGINIISITDHNTIGGVKVAIRDNPYKNMKIIPGIEFSCQPKGKIGEVHILGYGLDLENEKLNDITERIMQENRARIKSNLEVLKSERGIVFPEEDISEMFKAVGNIGRPEIAKLLVKYGHSETVRKAFDDILLPLEPRVIKRKIVLTEKDAIYYIKAAGGIPVLAHSATIKLDYILLKEYILQLQALGLGGVEVYHSKNSTELSGFLSNLAKEHGLFTSCGSDFHGELVAPGAHLGEASGKMFDTENINILIIL